MTPVQLRSLALNLVFWAVFAALWVKGLGSIPFSEKTGICWGLLFVFLVGQLCVLAANWKWVEWIGSALVFLGLIGTVIGFVIAFSGVDPATAADVSSVKPMVASLIQGMSTALYTTLIGAIGALWLSFNERLFREH